MIEIYFTLEESEKIFQTLKAIKLLIYKKIIVPLKELVQKEIKMKQTRRFVNSVTLKNVHWQLEQHTISNCVIMKLVPKPI